MTASLRRNAQAHITSLTTTLFIEVSVPNNLESHVFVCQRSCICVLEVMYLCVRGHVFVCQRSCICVLEVVYLCVRGHVFVCQRSCICVLEVMYLCVRGIDFAYFYDFSIRRWNFFDSVVFFVFHFNNKPKFNLYVVYLKK